MASRIIQNYNIRNFYTSSLLHYAPRTATTTTTTSSESESTKEVLTPLKIALNQYREWLATDGKKYRITGNTPNYVGKNKLPFPLNPYYKPIPPLSNITREEIYQLHTEEPQTWTVGKLANDYGISFDRVRAILKLKSVEKSAEKMGTPPQKDFAKRMEILLQAQNMRPGAARREHLRTMLARGLKPFLKMTEEDAALSPNDAARLLQLSPFASTKIKIDKASENKIDGKWDALHQVQVKQINPLHASRTKFAIRDVSAPGGGTLIRLKSGTLRSQTLKEKLTRPTIHRI